MRADFVQSLYEAYATNDRATFRGHLTEDFRFHAPPDPELDLDGFFERCWPTEQWVQRFDIVRTIESQDTIVVTYEATRTDGSRFRNTEVLTLEGERIREVEVYFGWELG